MHAEILKPVVVLVVWSLVMWGWMLAVRLPAMKAAGIELGKLVGTKGSDADRALPAKAQWPAHNYNHLMEQPTIFYAATVVLAVSGNGSGAAAVLAWAYAALRIAHSIVQATVNGVALRFLLFVASTAALIGLAALAAVVVF